GRTRIDVDGTAVHEGRRITLRRSFDLDLRPAFRVTAQVDKLTALPGGSVTVCLLADRVKPFAGPIAVQLPPVQGLELPETVTIPGGKDRVTFTVSVAADAAPRRAGIRAQLSATVGSYEEEMQAQLVEIEIRKPESPKK